MDKLTLQLPSGIASFCHRYPPANWRQFANIFLKTEESLVDYAKFCSSVMDIYSSLVVSTASENEVSFGWICGEDLNYFKRYYFNAFVLSSGPMQHDTRLVDMISGGFEGLSLPKGTRLDHLLRYTSYLRELHYVHKNYACRKILAKCDFIEWDSDFDEIFQRLKSEKKWSEFSDVSLKTALIEHFSLLHKLNDNLDISVGNMSEISSQGDSILEAITKDYSEELSRLTKGIAEVRMKNYVDHLEFKSLVNKCAAQAKALSTEVIAKDCALNPQKLFRLKDRAMTAESWMLEKFSRLKGRVRGNYVGPFTRGVPAFLLLAALSVAALGTLEDRKA
ncbi:uncharacterized protein LOC114276627 isoform X1 [Camellia sinensis]|uniref:uncharacterized protein LOC114276627 isoform X1 n=1 Tax=Camellia sinensis TaxID=4442 RepID=UPI0010358BF6|nr:uncharacterized protein LOC114276627 isoform X1 [Camellia sinensis]XP_028074226.1 uncharacterized protein LOC114276627 isoform X1 [Camellia sinensis]